MIHILKIAAVIIVVTYALRLVNAQSDWLVFAGLAIVGAAFYCLYIIVGQIVNQLKSKL
ncbi:hypothetical protein J2Y45_001457 [Dyadobacter sp. BE34]|uniref:Uncharacterized protein n=1 Tax=Dyadobacter fermentans TaxID=94254 RepID=A0ABU1QSZ5_9BACT|nr:MULTISPECIES: hypothetical protein [Dyadobacter]MDR6804188.1 hypothetical protein [Dyadobacter fermentans]MDR7041928.1 hypothetical protein [Dyadobacter sp. BE242]MDR7196331.1 hypothetical protein [Dyadobacter sp. BE34]MDR7213124.1 hypothetical protein [Dyadobacter sp. BE31]MDR7261737.1 hypothetical protein [Dyadobacter sp. BE32]